MVTTNFDLEAEAHRLRLPLNGIYNKDKLPAFPRNGFYIINIQDDFDSNGNDLPGSHWTVIYVEKNEAVYFDSFGMAPPLQVQNFLKSFVPYPYNRQVIQSIDSTVCGQYVIFFMWYMFYNQKVFRRLKRRLQSFLDIWSNDTSKNRELLLKYFSLIK